MTSAAVDPAARSSRTPVSPADFESFEPSGRRTSGWWANAGGRSRPSSRARRIWAGVACEQIPAADDEIDAVAQVVHDHAERVGPVAVPVADGQVAGRRDLARARPDEPRPSRPRAPSPSATRSTGPAPREPRSGSRPGTRDRTRVGRDRAAQAANVARVQSQPYTRPSRAEALERPRRRRRAAGVGLADRARRRPSNPSQARSSRSASSYSGRQRCRS